MSYTEFRDNIRNAPDMKRHFACAGVGIATTIAVVATGMPLLALGGVVLTAEFSKRNDTLPADTGVQKLLNFELMDFLKNGASYFGGRIATALLLGAMFGTGAPDQGPETIEPQGKIIWKQDAEQASVQVPANTFKPA